ncbi:ABC transporter permease, partial [Aliarcobacter butzleri]|uniref:ABC transporter permease n=1 Tax=Aliarcobacter butzleri TaxID=28197 RepID=UPI003B221F16
MKFEPTLFLTLPRIFALCVSLPLLVLFADILGVLGGMVIAFSSLDVTFIAFISTLHTEVPLKHLPLGVFKALFFGLAIATI